MFWPSQGDPICIWTQFLKVCKTQLALGSVNPLNCLSGFSSIWFENGSEHYIQAETWRHEESFSLMSHVKAFPFSQPTKVFFIFLLWWVNERLKCTLPFWEASVQCIIMPGACCHASCREPEQYALRNWDACFGDKYSPAAMTSPQLNPALLSMQWPLHTKWWSTSLSIGGVLGHLFILIMRQLGDVWVMQIQLSKGGAMQRFSRQNYSHYLRQKNLQFSKCWYFHIER